MNEAKEKWVAVGKVGRAKGLRGELRVSLYHRTSDLIFGLDRIRIGADQDHAESFGIEEVDQQGQRTILRLEGVGTREAAERLTGRELFVSRSEFPEPAAGEYYCCDVVGMAVVSEQGKVLGVLEQILPTASNDIYVVRGPAGETLLPATREVILKIDLERKEILVREPEVVDAV